MSEVLNQKYSELIKAGQTKESFIAKFKELFVKKQTQDEISVFDDTTDDDTISAIFNAFTDAAADDSIGDTLTITQKDIDVISKYDGDSESISEKDILMYYEDKIKNYQKELNESTITDEPEVSPKEGSISAKPVITTAKGLDILSNLKQLKILEASANKHKIQNEIDELIAKLDEDKRKNAEKINNKIKKNNNEISESKLLLAEKEDKLKILEAKIAKKEAEIAETKDENKKSDLEKELGNLKVEFNLITKDTKSVTKRLSSLKSEQEKLSKKLYEILNKNDSDSEIQSKREQLSSIDVVLEEDLANIDSQIMQYQNQLLATSRMSGTQAAHYDNIAKGYVSDGTVGKTAAQALSNAAGEIGTREVTGHNDGAAVAKYRGGVDNGVAWCASFVSWCYKGNEIFGYQASVSGIRQKAQEKGLYSDKSQYIPKPGDVMIQKSNGASHTGLVERVDSDGTVHTIEGNAGNMVKRVTYKVGSSGYNKISGYVRMSEA